MLVKLSLSQDQTVMHLRLTGRYLPPSANRSRHRIANRIETHFAGGFVKSRSLIERHDWRPSNASLGLPWLHVLSALKPVASTDPLGDLCVDADLFLR